MGVPEQDTGVTGQIRDHLTAVTEIITTNVGVLNDFIERLQENMAYTVPISSLAYTVPHLDVNPFAGQPPAVPTLQTVNPAYPTDFSLTPIPVDIALFPTMDTTAPEIPDRGTITLQELDFTVNPPSINSDIHLPVMPQFTMPQDYAVVPITIRALQGFQIPGFNGTPPEDDIGSLQVDYTYRETGYQSPLATQLEAWIIEGLTNGGTGLAPAVEQAIFDSFRARLDEEFASAYEKEMKFFAVRGFTRPPGALRGALQEVHNQFNRRIAEANRDIMSKQADLAQTNTQFILKMAGEYERFLRDFYTATEARAMESAKNVVLLAIAQQQARIARYNAVLDAYKTSAAVYESQIRAMMLVIEEYKAELEAGKLSMEVQLMQGQVYRDKLAGIALLLDAYEKEMKGAVSFIEVERNKILLFQSQIEAFVARLGVDDRRIKLHTSLLGSDQVRAQLWAEKIRGYGLLADTVKSRNDSHLAVANLQNDILNKTGIEAYRLQLARTESIIKNVAVLNEGELKKFEVESDLYKSEIGAYSAQMDAMVKAFEAQSRYVASQISLILKEAEQNQQALNAEHMTKIESLKAVVNVLAQLVSAAIGAIHASLQLGYQGSYSKTASYHPDKQISESHNYSDWCAPSCGGINA